MWNHHILTFLLLIFQRGGGSYIPSFTLDFPGGRWRALEWGKKCGVSCPKLPTPHLGFATAWPSTPHSLFQKVICIRGRRCKALQHYESHIRWTIFVQVSLQCPMSQIFTLYRVNIYFQSGGLLKMFDFTTLKAYLRKLPCN